MARVMDNFIGGQFIRFEPRPGGLALLWLPPPSWRAWWSLRTSGPGSGSGDKLRGAKAVKGRDPGGGPP